ncbi:hypothetical protein GWN26_13400, partial [Candidatus Saccharibacteria bacterium]|nr:hypothetical protein [Calditrichia bacterium]NIV72854.1 hypothetical protein [Calditrichia bacterium]NIW00054.1 hypothetical protein [Candidatus Saccharibacteria bacterium]NIW78001.1 hypothetical protein [Calditrichia bacterium]
MKIVGDLFMIVGFAEGVRVGVMKGFKRKGGYWIIVAGSVLLFLFVVYQLFINFQLIKPIAGIFLVYIYGFLGFLLSMSVFL